MDFGAIQGLSLVAEYVPGTPICTLHRLFHLRTYTPNEEGHLLFHFTGAKALRLRDLRRLTRGHRDRCSEPCRLSPEPSNLNWHRVSLSTGRSEAINGGREADAEKAGQGHRFLNSVNTWVAPSSFSKLVVSDNIYSKCLDMFSTRIIHPWEKAELLLSDDLCASYNIRIECLLELLDLKQGFLTA